MVISDQARKFAERAKAGHRPSVNVSTPHVALFLSELAREGVSFAADCLDHIRDERLREIVATVLFATAGGAVLGASIGASIGGPAGAPIGAVVGTAVGLLAGCIAVGVTLRETSDGRLLVAAT